MADLNKTRKRNRLKGYNYSNPGNYFVTICIQGKLPPFGRFFSGRFELNERGKVAQKCALEIPRHHENVILEEHMIMPDHVHLLLTIKRKAIESYDRRYGLLSKIVKSYKEAVTKEIKRREPGIEFAWQRSFYDHIVRNAEPIRRIRDYIKHNPEEFGKFI
jgi:REP element-mobilizing transposase RayT